MVAGPDRCASAPPGRRADPLGPSQVPALQAEGGGGGMALKLFSFPGDKNSYKGLVAAQYAGVAVELAKDFKMGVTNKEAAFLQKNPHGKVPVLQAEGGCVFESNAIARYIARLSDCGLFGATLIDHGHVEQWIDFASNEIDAPLSSWVLPVLGVWPYSEAKEAAAIAAVKKALAVLDAHLATRTYLVGDFVTLADIVACCNLLPGMVNVMDGKFMQEFGNVQRWFTTCVAKPEFSSVMGTVTVAKKAKKAAK